MDPAAAAAAALLERLQSPEAEGLYEAFSSFLLPFQDFTPLDSHNPSATTRCRRRTSAAPSSRKTTTKRKKKEKRDTDPKSLRPLAKQFLQFLCQTLKALPFLLRRNPQPSSGANQEVDQDRAKELLAVYGLAADCLWCIAPCLDGKPASVLLHRCRLVRYLESWGRYAKAEEEALATLALICSLLAPAKKGKSVDGSCILPDPKLVGDVEPEIGTLAVEVLIGLTGSTFKSEKQDASAYERILDLVQQVQPWLRLLDTEAFERNHSQLVNALYRCSGFLAAESVSFGTDLVRQFCSTTLRECLKSSYKDRFPSIARKICSSSKLESRPLLILDALRISLDSIVCECKIDKASMVDEYLVFILYCADSLCATNVDICRDASVLLYTRGGDIIEVSPSIGSILTLYATGLFLKSSSVQAKESGCVSQNVDNSLVISILLNNGDKLESLIDSLSTLGRYYQNIGSSEVSPGCSTNEPRDLSVVDLTPKKHLNFICMHGNASQIAYLDALEFLCKLLVEDVNTGWKHWVSEENSVNVANLNHVQDALHQFCDSFLPTYRSTTTCEKDRERLYESRKTVLQVAVSEMKVSLSTAGNLQDSLQTVDSVISSLWIEPQELKFLISALNNIGASLYDVGHLKQASTVLELCCRAILTHIKVLLRMYSDNSKGYYAVDISEDAVKLSISDAYARTATILDFLYKCSTANIHDIAAKFLFEISCMEDVFQNYNRSLPLVKQWVKIMCKDFENIDVVDKAPVLYTFLSSSCSTWSKKILGKILEQELLAYEIMHNRNPKFCREMHVRVTDILLNDVYTTEDCNMQRSRVLVKKARVLRASGIERLSSCIECLSEAISILNDISDVSSADITSVCHQLALVYCLHAQCAQEANQDCEVIHHNIQSAVNLWSNIDAQNYSCKDRHHELTAENTLPLLCNIVDLLSIKGCLKVQFEMCRLIFMFCKQGNIPVEKCLAMLWTSRRLNHALCTSAVGADFISKVSDSYGICVNSFDHWISCIEDPPSRLMFLQSVLLCDSLLTEVSFSSSSRYFGSNLSIPEVKKVASSLISDVPLFTKQVYIAGYLYHDLSERLFSTGQVFEALSHAREALQLRKKVLQRKFSYYFEQNAELGKTIKSCQNRNESICLEALGSVITEVWPDTSKSSIIEDSVISPWSALKCYLDSTLQVGILYEATGDGAEAECLFQIGKRISNLQGLPIYGIAFTSSLGQLYRKKQFLDLAEEELNNARQILLQNDIAISCKFCKLSFEVTIDMQLADLSRSCFEKGLQIQAANEECLSHALCLYASSLEKLKHAEFYGSGICEKMKTMSEHSNNNIGAAGKGILNCSRSQSPGNVGRLHQCSTCKYLESYSNVQHGRQMGQDNGKIILDTEGEGPHMIVAVKKKSRNPSKSFKKEQVINAEIKQRRTRSNRYSVADQAVVNRNNSPTCELCPEGLETSCLKPNCTSLHTGCNGKCLCARTNCWRCFLIIAIDLGLMEDIIYLKWEFCRRRLIVKLLMKKARCLMANRGNHGAHELHEIYWQCISVLLHRKPFSQSYTEISCFHLMELIGEDSSRDIFTIERATMLYSFSLFSLMECLSENSRNNCCNFSNIMLSEVIPWLLKAFMLCRELPLLFQKVSKLLASTIIVSTSIGPVSFPLFSGKSLSLGHWAAFFHQVSLGTYVHCEHLNCARRKATKNSGIPVNGSLFHSKESNFFRYAPEKFDQLEEFVSSFFQRLPSLPIVCLSMLGGDYVNILGEALRLPSFFPAWLLLTRLNGNNQPIVMLLPADFIVEEAADAYFEKEVDLTTEELTKNWQCPWGDTVVDYVAPSFKMLLEDNFSSLFTPVSTDVQISCMRWWSQRTRLNDRLHSFLSNMENSWLGPWGCLLLGEHLDTEYLDTLVLKLINDLEVQYSSEVNKNLVKAILGGAKSIADAEACVSQLLLYKGFFGRGACCGKDNLRAFSSTYHKGKDTLAGDHVSDFIHKFMLEAIAELPETVGREPVILVLDSDIQMLPWKNIPAMRNQEVYRMPSVTSIMIVLNRNCQNVNRNKAISSIYPTIDPLDAYYLLNPSGDLSSTQTEFEEWFRSQNWEGKAGTIPTTEELVLALQRHDLFLYFGHGNGTQYIPGHEIQKLDHCAATFLMGCSSGSLLQKGCYAPQGAPLFYLSAGSPAVIANLWDVTDKDIDRFGKAMLSSWLEEQVSVNCTSCDQLVKPFECIKVEDEKNATSNRNRRKASRGKKEQQSCDIEKLKICEKAKLDICEKIRIASFMNQARSACRLPLLIGAAPVCYGVPTIIRRKS